MKKIVIAIGNGGCNIADDISSKANVKDVSFIYCDLDEHELATHGTINDLYVGPDDIEGICEVVKVCSDDLVLIVSCLGGKAGSTFAPIIAEKMAESGATVSAFVSKPLRLEGECRLLAAQEAENRLRKCCKLVVCQDNEKLSEQIALDSINESLCKQATALLSMNQTDSRRIDNPDGVKKLMETLWLSHQLGLPKPVNNMFWVDLEPWRRDEMVQEPEIDNRNTVKRLLDSVKFDDLVNFLCTSGLVKRNLIVFKDAFDFLRDQHLLETYPGTIKFLTRNVNDSEEISVEHDEVSTPEELVSLKVEVDDNLGITPEILVIKLLCLVTSEGKESVYHYFKSDEKASNLISDYFREMRRQQSWWYRIFTRPTKKIANKAVLNRLQDSAIARLLETQCLGDSWASNPFPFMDESWVVKDVRSHISETIAEDYIEHLLRNYDFEDYSKYSQKIINILSSDKDKLKRLTPFIAEHFGTSSVYPIQIGNEGIMMSIILIP